MGAGSVVVVCGEGPVVVVCVVSFGESGYVCDGRGVEKGVVCLCVCNLCCCLVNMYVIVSFVCVRVCDGRGLRTVGVEQRLFVCACVWKM